MEKLNDLYIPINLDVMTW